jgi:hypothetical protein
MAGNPAPKACVYCGGNIGRVKKGEHVIPAAIGGALTIKTVCQACNNLFSRIDAELCSRSALSIVASQELDAHLWQVWDVDHAAKNLFLEASPDWSAKSFKLYPQVVFERSGPQIRGDYQEMIRFGKEAFQQVLVKGMLRACRRFNAGQPRWLHRERMPLNPDLAKQYRLPPRIFVRHSITELADLLSQNKRASFVLRYETDADWRFAMNVLSKWEPTPGYQRFDVRLGTHLPTFRFTYDGTEVLRALAKIGINLLAAHCCKTRVNWETFRDVIAVVMGKSPVSLPLMNANGFVDARGIEPIRAQARAHSFRLLHSDGHWHIYSSFFGGRVGSFVRFPGPNHEEWNEVDIIAPLGSPSWTVATGRIIQPFPVSIEWRNLRLIVPSIEMFNTAAD